MPLHEIFQNTSHEKKKKKDGPHDTTTPRHDIWLFSTLLSGIPFVLKKERVYWTAK